MIFYLRVKLGCIIVLDLFGKTLKIMCLFPEMNFKMYHYNGSVVYSVHLTGHSQKQTNSYVFCLQRILIMISTQTFRPLQEFANELIFLVKISVLSDISSYSLNGPLLLGVDIK